MSMICRKKNIFTCVHCTLSNENRLSIEVGPIVFGLYGWPKRTIFEVIFRLLHAAHMICPLFVTFQSAIILKQGHVSIKCKILVGHVVIVFRRRSFR